MEISIVIPTFNRKKVLVECLRLLNNQTARDGSFEVILVDDASSDGTKEEVERLEKNYPFKYIYQENQGSAAARNNGIKEASGRIILFIDDDVLAHPRLVETHLKLQKGQNDLIVRGPIINIPRLEIPLDRPIGIWDMNKNFFCTSNVSVAKEQIIKAGMFDPLFQWWVDCELGFRLRMMGLRWKFSLDAIVFHYKPFLEDELENIKRWAVKRGKYAVKLYKKHPHWRIQLTTGIHWLSFLIAAIFNNKIITRFYEKIFNTSKGDNRFYYRSLLTSQIANYYYIKTIKEELKAEKH